MYKVDTTAEIYLELFQIYIGLCSFENSSRSKEKSSIVDNWHGF